MNLIKRIFGKSSRPLLYGQAQSLWEMLPINVKYIPDTTFVQIDEETSGLFSFYTKKLSKKDDVIFESVQVKIHKYNGEKIISLSNSNLRSLPLHLLESFVNACHRIYGKNHVGNPKVTFENNDAAAICAGNWEGRIWIEAKEQLMVTLRQNGNRLELNIEPNKHGI